MSERPIIVSGPMVRALLDGRKTQTRRLAWRREGVRGFVEWGEGASPWQRVRPGDTLWVREAWAPHPGGVMRHGAVYRAEPDAVPDAGRWRPSIHMPRWASRITLHVEAVRVERLQDISAADAEAEGLECLSKDQGRVWKWGLPGRDGLPGADDGGWPWTMWCIGHKPAFASLWNSLHGPDAWAANPEVVVLQFRVAKEPGHE